MATAIQSKIISVRGGADKSLARPGRKQATATKQFSTLLTKEKAHRGVQV
jgi:hypothetical protein